MTYVVQQSVSVDSPGSGVQLAYSDGRLVVNCGNRSVTFKIDAPAGVAQVVADMHQPESVSASEIPTEIRNHVLHIGYRIYEDNVDDGGFTLLTGNSR